MYSHRGIGGRDATILATAEKLGEKMIVTHDKVFRGLECLEVIDPVRIDPEVPER